MFTIPFRRAAAASLSDAIRTYIDARYGQQPDMFRTDLETIDALRYAAIHVQEPHASGVRKLLAYAAQLVWMGGKFPIDVRCFFLCRVVTRRIRSLPLAASR
jgi:programmed cell death 6-interacting protein